MTKNSKLYQDETVAAVNWLFSIQEKENFGWSWIKHISPNIQNTAEVVYALSKHPQVLNGDQKEFLRCAVEYWLLEAPQYYADLSRDWMWALMALDEYVGSEVFEADKFDMDAVEQERQRMVSEILGFQNPDGGWPDIAGEVSAISKTGLASYVLSRYYTKDAKVAQAIDKAMEFLKDVQNGDGGFGNIRKNDMLQDSQKKLLELSYENVEAQYLSSAACTSYCILGMNSVSPHKYAQQIKSASDYLVRIQNADGHWNIFYEVGIKSDSIFTFRHFGTAWAMKALFDCTFIDKNAPFMLKGIQYLVSLQDDVYGGWRSSPDSDTYTWSTCNALCVIADHREYFENVKAELFHKILNEWRFGKSASEDADAKQNRFFISLSVLLYCISVCLALALAGVLFFDKAAFGDTTFKFFLAIGYMSLLVPLDIYLFKKHAASKSNGLLILLVMNLIGLVVISF